jgi:HlyD family secretion protein
MKLPIASSPVQIRQTKQEFTKIDNYLDYELAKAVQELPPLYTRLVAVSLSFVVFGAIAWAALSKVDEVAVASGKVLAGEQEVQPVRSLSSGTIKYINEAKVREGQQIQKGEILIKLDSTALQADIETLKNQAQSIKQDIERTTKAADGSHQADMDKAQIEYDRLENNLEFAKLKERKECPFFASVYKELPGAYREKCKDAQNQLNNAKKFFEAQKQEIKKIKEDYKTGSLSGISKREEELLSVEGKLKQTKNQLENQNITAPIDGEVYNIKVNLGQGAVQSGQELLSIVPVDRIWEKPVIEVNLPAQYQGFINRGMRAKVKIDTFPYQAFGTVDGIVIYISPNAISKDSSGKQVFPTRIKLRANSLRVGEDYKKITSGMPVTGEIVMREKTVLSLLLDPITQQVDSVFSKQ